ncbi:hypothetical protein LCGC14_0233000 [marine sediment metagenome]|uniref:Uncharacterized protein n=1 Tax=marine sediment metagenome TaxID=412755 RepID=A0A0F9XDT1_9ZZZZ
MASVLKVMNGIWAAYAAASAGVLFDSTVTQALPPRVNGH